MDDKGLTFYNEEMNSGYFTTVFSESEREGLKALILNFIDKKLARIQFKYTGFTEWSSMTEFVDAVAKPLRLPSATNWETTEEGNLRISCKGMFAEIHFREKISQHSLQEQSLTLSVSDYENILKQREQTKIERQKQVFKP